MQHLAVVIPIWQHAVQSLSTVTELWLTVPQSSMLVQLNSVELSWLWQDGSQLLQLVKLSWQLEQLCRSSRVKRWPGGNRNLQQWRLCCTIVNSSSQSGNQTCRY